MKIAICPDACPEEYTAAAAYLSVLEKGLREKGHTVKLFCASPTQRRLRSSHEIAILPGKYTIDFFESTAKLLPLFSLGKLLDEFAPDLIEIGSSGHLGLAAYFYAKRRKIKTVFTSFTVFEFLKHEELGLFERCLCFFGKLRVKKLLSGCDKTLVFNEKAAEIFERYTRGRTVEVLPVTVDSSLFSSQSEAAEESPLALSPAESGLLYCGRLDLTTLEALFEAFSGASTPAEHLRLVIAGSGIEKEHLLETAKRCGVTSMLQFLGEIEREKMPALYRSCLAFLMPEDDEKMHFSPFEAVACGTPVLMHRGAFCADAVEDGKNGFLFGNNHELRSLIQKFTALDRASLPALRAVVARSARGADQDLAARWREDLYAELLAEKEPAKRPPKAKPAAPEKPAAKKAAHRQGPEA